MSNSAPSRAQPLDEWLRWLETIHPVAIDMGLERVASVADRLALRPSKTPLILVGGTNGKGSTVAMLTAIYQAAGYSVGAYTSPHITHFCERIAVNGKMVEQSAVVDALACIEAGREPETLTYFEYTTLAAMHVFNVKQCDVLLFEVGLGGRLDATNIWDAQCSIVTSVALDHEDYLGSDVSVIATEKAAIGRRDKPFVVGEANPPASLAHYAQQHGFQFIDVGAKKLSDLPITTVSSAHQRRNAGCAKAAVDALQHVLPVKAEVIDAALLGASLPGRFEQIMVDGVRVVFDVAHNPAGAQALAATWESELGSERCHVVFAALGDKDVAGVAQALEPIAEHWYCIPLDTERAMSVDDLVALVEGLLSADSPRSSVHACVSAQAGLSSALVDARQSGIAVLVAGSFYTIAAVRAFAAAQSDVDA